MKTYRTREEDQQGQYIASADLQDAVYAFLLIACLLYFIWRGVTFEALGQIIYQWIMKG